MAQMVAYIFKQDGTIGLYRGVGIHQQTFGVIHADFERPTAIRILAPAVDV